MIYIAWNALNLSATLYNLYIQPCSEIVRMSHVNVKYPSTFI